VLICDEAVSALDVSVQASILNLLGDLRAAGGVSLIFITHDLGVVRQVTDELIVMESGRIVEHARTEAVLDDPQHPYTKRLRSYVPRKGWKPQRLVRA
jgi:ABC-type oligopeptide transport system ATPase subunit